MAREAHAEWERLFNAAGVPMVDNYCMGGYNSCLFAYGQIRDDDKKGVYVDNLKEVEVATAWDVIQQLIQDSVGGNSKTIIVANISPSSWSVKASLFINSLSNLYASGDVVAMGMEIQQLKTEVSRFWGLANGGAESLVNDTLTNKDYKLALVGDFRREKEKDISLHALVAENQAALQLLLEALDWTLMHESGSSVVQRENSVAMTEACTDGDLLISSKLKTMVDAIAVVSWRQQAHQTAIGLSKMLDELSLIELYDGKDMEMKREAENLELQLAEMHEENEQLLGLYEKAIQEMDEFKRMISLSGQNRAEASGGIYCPEKLVEIDGGKRHLTSVEPGRPALNGQDMGENSKFENLMSGQNIYIYIYIYIVK
ncbi:kinesin-like protein KIN-12E [Citrus sinensis]|nr:kinesin-like protein KIN-12E [Citrus sinensis]